MPDQRSNGPGLQRDVDGLPVDERGLRFHDPEVLALEPAGEIVREAVLNGVDGAGANVVVPRCEVEHALSHVMIVGIEEAHGVGGDELALVGERTDHVDLVEQVAAPRVGDEEPPTQQQARVTGFMIVVDGNGNLGPIGVGLRPVGGGPAGVQVVERTVARSQPVLEELLRVVVDGGGGDFVVELPADDVGIVAEALGKPANDVARELPVLRAGEVVLQAVAMLIALAVVFDAKRLGILLREPGGRRCGGGAQHRVDAVLAGEINGALHPVELVDAFGRLERAPGKLADADDMEVRLLHEREVSLPA
jgi:hypothetical protein